MPGACKPQEALGLLVAASTGKSRSGEMPVRVACVLTEPHVANQGTIMGTSELGAAMQHSDPGSENSVTTRVLSSAQNQHLGEPGGHLPCAAPRSHIYIPITVCTVLVRQPSSPFCCCSGGGGAVQCGMHGGPTQPLPWSA